jgi:excisionase family DNA binding protein
MNEWISTSEAGRHLHVSAETVRRWLREGKLPHVSTRVTEGGHLRLRLADLTGGESEQSQEPAAAKQQRSSKLLSKEQAEALQFLAILVAVLLLFGGGFAGGSGYPAAAKTMIISGFALFFSIPVYFALSALLPARRSS